MTSISMLFFLLAVGPMYAMAQVCGTAVSGWTQFDKPFKFECPCGMAIKRWESRHENKYEDRIYFFTCENLPTAAIGCEWSDYLNNFDKPINFNCPDNGVFTGVESYHQNQQDDRRYKIRCCGVQNRVHTNCKTTGYLNQFDKPIDFLLPEGHYITGTASYHANYQEDRRFKFTTCSLKA